MLLEMHAHTTRYSSCSHMSPEQYIMVAKKKGLDGICLTEHNTFWLEYEFQELCSSARGLIVINGIEQRCWDGDILQGDFLVFGCRFSLDRPTVSQLVDMVHRAGGVIIAAHPFRQEIGVSEELVYKLDLDGLEAYSSNQESRETRLAIKVAEKMGIPVIAGSDAHVPELVGWAVSEFEDNIKNEVELVEAIKTRRFKPVIVGRV